MRKSLIMILLLLSFTLSALKNWKVYTNTTHIKDVVEYNDKLYFATWGGLAIYNLQTDNYEEPKTTINGLNDNDINCLAVSEQNDQLLIGSANSGVNRLNQNEFIMPITETLGLASKKVHKIIQRDTLLFAATKNGLSIFYDDPEFPFPLLLNNYNSLNGLSADNIKTLQISDNGYIFCGSDYGLDFTHIDSLETNNAWNAINSNNSILPDSRVNSIYVKANEIVVGTRGGLAISYFPNFNWITYDENYFGNETSSIFPVYIDNNFDIWAGAGYWNEDDLYVEDSTDIAVFKIYNGGGLEFLEQEDMNLSDSQIMGFKEINGQMFAYTWGEGFVSLDNNSSEWSDPIKANCIVSNHVTDLQIDQNNKIWVCNGQRLSSITHKSVLGISSFDGFLWENYSKQNTELHTNNITSIAIDEDNRKWFGGWIGGISILNDESQSWDRIVKDDIPMMTSNTISCIGRGFNNNMWIGAYPNEMIVLNNEEEVIQDFEIYQPISSYDFTADFWKVHFSTDRVILGTYYNGFRIWDDLSYPEDNGSYWIKPPFSELTSTQIFAIDSRQTNFGTEEIWIAGGSGLFLYDGNYWYKYGTHVKKKIWLDGEWFWNEDNPDPEYWYYEGQTRLFGSQVTYPTALFIDPFGIMWIGTDSAGITAFDLEKELFTNYTTENTSLLSNTITDFEYEPNTGVLYIGTNKGLNAADIGITENMNQETELYNIICYPNPFYPEQGDILNIKNDDSITMPKGDTTCKIFNLNGELIIELEKDKYEQFCWNGKNKADKKCSSGMYYYLISTSNGQIAKGKIALIR